MTILHAYIQRFARRDDGAQVLEYGLLVAVVTLALLLLLKPLVDSGYFAPFLARLASCLTGTCA